MNKLNTMFMNSKSKKTFEPHRLLFNVADKINLKGSDKNLIMYYTRKK